MFSRLSASAQRVLRAAEQECRNRNQYYIGVEHVMLALLEDEDPEIEGRLAALGTPRRALHAAVRAALGMGEKPLWEGILITPRARTAFASAEQAADGDQVRPAHLFDAILHSGGPLSHVPGLVAVTPAALRQ